MGRLVFRVQTHTTGKCKNMGPIYRSYIKPIIYSYLHNGGTIKDTTILLNFI